MYVIFLWQKSILTIVTCHFLLKMYFFILSLDSFFAFMVLVSCFSQGCSKHRAQLSRALEYTKIEHKAQDRKVWTPVLRWSVYCSQLTSCLSSAVWWWSLWRCLRSHRRPRPRSPRSPRWRWTGSRCRCLPWTETDPTDWNTSNTSQEGKHHRSNMVLLKGHSLRVCCL